MEKSKTFEDLTLWQKALELILCNYKVAKGFPVEEFYGITSQIKRALTSVTANIAEGLSENLRPRKQDFSIFLKRP